MSRYPKRSNRTTTGADVMFSTFHPAASTAEFSKSSPTRYNTISIVFTLSQWPYIARFISTSAFSLDPSLRTVRAVVFVAHNELYRQYGEMGSRRNAVKNGSLSYRFCKRTYTSKLWRSRATVVACENVIDFHLTRLYVNFSLHLMTTFLSPRPSPRAGRHNSLGDFVFVNFI